MRACVQAACPAWRPRHRSAILSSLSRCTARRKASRLFASTVAFASTMRVHTETFLAFFGCWMDDPRMHASATREDRSDAPTCHSIVWKQHDAHVNTLLCMNCLPSILFTIHSSIHIQSLRGSRATYSNAPSAAITRTRAHRSLVVAGCPASKFPHFSLKLHFLLNGWRALAGGEEWRTPPGKRTHGLRALSAATNVRRVRAVCRTACHRRRARRAVAHATRVAEASAAGTVYGLCAKAIRLWPWPRRAKGR